MILCQCEGTLVFRSGLEYSAATHLHATHYRAMCICNYEKLSRMRGCCLAHHQLSAGV